ncbi:hypothetical protein PR048_011690 [Dryococelus australis]|uniref:Integrase catalytic domain-containing protein n=1 Tax=Dryococelus australis TaxID=614101 RepID=A0ABQ9HME2_9NEOP|nr:hypothetical protein PR048_011690 [Dryococelus australis]
MYYFVTPRNMKAGNIVKTLVDCVWKIFGSPEQLVSDKASYFNSRILKDICFEWEMKHINTCPYYPFPNLVDRVNKNVKVALSIFHNHGHHCCDQNIWELSLVFNSIPHATTGMRSAVFSIEHLGHTPENLDTTNQKELYSSLEKAMRTVARKYNAGRLNNKYDVGDLLLYCQ